MSVFFICLLPTPWAPERNKTDYKYSKIPKISPGFILAQRVLQVRLYKGRGEGEGGKLIFGWKFAYQNLWVSTCLGVYKNTTW